MVISPNLDGPTTVAACRRGAGIDLQTGFDDPPPAVAYKLVPNTLRREKDVLVTGRRADSQNAMSHRTRTIPTAIIDEPVVIGQGVEVQNDRPRHPRIEAACSGNERSE